MTAIKVTEFEGNGIGPELQESEVTITEALPIDLVFEPVDWSLETRERDGDEAIDAAEVSATNIHPVVATMHILCGGRRPWTSSGHYHE